MICHSEVLKLFFLNAYKVPNLNKTLPIHQPFAFRFSLFLKVSYIWVKLLFNAVKHKTDMWSFLERYRIFVCLRKPLPTYGISMLMVAGDGFLWYNTKLSRCWKLCYFHSCMYVWTVKCEGWAAFVSSRVMSFTCCHVTSDTAFNSIYYMRWGEFLFHGIYSYLPNFFFTSNYERDSHFLVNHNESTFNDMRVTLVYCRILHDHAQESYIFKKQKLKKVLKMWKEKMNSIHVILFEYGMDLNPPVVHLCRLLRNTLAI